MAEVKLLRKTFILVVGLLILLGGCCLAVVVSQPCSRLDLVLNYTGCIRQLDTGALSNGVFTRDLTMFGGVTVSRMSIWRISDGRQLHTTSGSVGIFSPDGAFFIGNSNYPFHIVSVWRTQDWTLQTSLDTDMTRVTDIAIAPDMSSLAIAGSAGPNGLIQVWQTRDQALLHNLKGHTHYILVWLTHRMGPY
jgi:hypothetical protein